MSQLKALKKRDSGDLSVPLNGSSLERVQSPNPAPMAVHTGPRSRKMTIDSEDGNEQAGNLRIGMRDDKKGASSKRSDKYNRKCETFVH